MAFFKSSYSKNVLTLVTGTALAQAIPLALSPILTRIYSPSDFGILATYMSLVALGAVVTSLRYDQAIIIPERDEDSANVTVLAILISLVTSIILLLVVIFFRETISSLLLEDPEERATLAKWFFFVPLSVFLMGLFNAISFWLNRKKVFRAMATSKVVYTSGMSAFQIAVGLIKKSPVGLLIGFIFGRLFSVLYLLHKINKDRNPAFSQISRTQMLHLLKRYKRFPYFSLPGSFLNVASNQLPILIIGKYFGGVILGNYSLMERVLNAPISLLGRSVLDVFKQKASEDYIKYGNCKKIYLKTFKTLVALSILPTIVLFTLSPLIFGFVFGKEWVIAGEFAQILSILFFFRFTASPLSYMFFIAEKQHQDMIWQIGLLLVTVASFFTGIYYDNIKLALICFTASYSMMYVINLFMTYSLAKGISGTDGKNQ